MRWVMTRVLPLPGPARMSTGPSVVVTACFCGSFSPASKSVCSNIVSSSTSKDNIVHLHDYLRLNPCYCITVGYGIGALYSTVRDAMIAYVIDNLKERSLWTLSAIHHP